MIERFIVKPYIRPAIEFLVFIAILMVVYYLLLLAGVPTEKATRLSWTITALVFVAYLAYLKIEEKYGGLGLDKLFPPRSSSSEEGYVEQKPSARALARARKALRAAQKKRRDTKEKGEEATASPSVDMILPDTPSSGKSTSSSTSSKGSDMKKAVMSGLSWLGEVMIKYWPWTGFAFSILLLVACLSDGSLDPIDWIPLISTVLALITALHWWKHVGSGLLIFVGFCGEHLGKALSMKYGAFACVLSWTGLLTFMSISFWILADEFDFEWLRLYAGVSFGLAILTFVLGGVAAVNRAVGKSSKA